MLKGGHKYKPRFDHRTFAVNKGVRESAINSLRSMLWCFDFRGSIVGMLAILCVKGVANDASDLTHDTGTVELFRTNAHSFSMAMVALFMAITGGEHWWFILASQPWRPERCVILFVL